MGNNPHRGVCVLKCGGCCVWHIGDALADVVRELIPGCAVGKILIQRDESTPDKRAKVLCE